MQTHQLCGQSADRCRRTLFTGKFHGSVEVLEQGPHVPLHRLKSAFGHLRGKDLQRFRIGETACQGFGDQAGLYTGTLGQRHHFSDDQRIAGDNHLIAGFGHLPRPDCAHMGDTLAQIE